MANPFTPSFGELPSAGTEVGSGVARRADHPALLGPLPDIGVDATALVADVDAGRNER